MSAKQQDQQPIIPMTFQDLPEGRFKTGFFDMFAEPGGVTLCLMGWCCGCITAGQNNEGNGGYMGFWGGCLGSLVPILGCFCIWANAAKTAEFSGFTPNLVQSILKTCCCGCFYNCQTRREQLIIGLKNGQMAMVKQGAPGSENYQATSTEVKTEGQPVTTA